MYGELVNDIIPKGGGGEYGMNERMAMMKNTQKFPWHTGTQNPNHEPSVHLVQD
jgi:hypothetical protein